MKKILLILGTRPEAIKLCPLALALRASGNFDIRVCVTGQHRQLLDPILSAFGVRADEDLNLMQPAQTLGGLTSRLVAGLDAYLQAARPDLVLVQGDTTTAFCGALAAYYQKIPVGHVEAGLRTGNKQAPWPEEANRVLVSVLADYHFAPTPQARENLLREHVAADRIHVTGNTGIDALFLARGRVEGWLHDWHAAGRPSGGLEGTPLAELPLLLERLGERRLVLITGHRRENFGIHFENICRGISMLARAFADVAFFYPMHLNPRVREPVGRLLGAHANVHLIEPLSYFAFVALMDRSFLILTDSGGIQEEAPSLGKPVLVMRTATERPEGVAAGTVRLVGADAEKIREEVTRLLTEPAAYRAMAKCANPYGDGQACQRIIEVLHTLLSASPC